MLHSLFFFFGLLLLILLANTNLDNNFYIFCSFFLIAILFNLSFFSIIYKIRYFILALLIVYSLSTPGEILLYYSFISITKEGFILGINNSLRIINTFLTVMLLMKFIPKSFFINFIIKLCYPLKWFGLNMDNLTSRIFLTFEYFNFYKDFSFNFSNFTKIVNQQINDKSSIVELKELPKLKPVLKDYCWIISFFSFFIVIQLI